MERRYVNKTFRNSVLAEIPAFSSKPYPIYETVGRIVLTKPDHYKHQSKHLIMDFNTIYDVLSYKLMQF